MNEAEGGESARATLAHLRAARPCGTGLVPSMYRTRALTRSTFFSPGLNGRPSTCAHVWHVQSVHARAQWRHVRSQRGWVEQRVTRMLLSVLHKGLPPRPNPELAYPTQLQQY